MVNNRRINYVLACWAGRRRVIDPREACPGALYLERHIQSLQSLPHKLDQITVMIPECPSSPPAFWNTVDSLPKKIGSAKVIVACRENAGLSYGSWSRAYDYYRTDFDYYFFMEDDYKFCQDNFDEKMIDLMSSLPICGYLAGQCWECQGVWPFHAGMSCGVAITEALEKSYDLHGRLPYDVESLSNRYVSGERSQVVFSRGISIDVGYNLFDVSSRYRIVFRQPNFMVSLWHGGNRPAILDVI